MTKKEIYNEEQQIALAKIKIKHFAPIYEKYYNSVFRFIYSRIEDKETTADLCSTSFLKAMKNIKSFKYKGVSIQSWIMRIASNEIKLYYRSQSTHQKYFIEQKYLDSLNNELELNQNSELLIEYLEGISESDYELIQMKYFENMSFKDISIVLNKSEESLRVRLHRLKKQMKQGLLNFSRLKGVEFVLSLSLLLLIL